MNNQSGQLRFASNRFLVLGRAGMDFYADPAGTEIEVSRHFVAHLGGSAANIAVALTKLGARASLVTRVSDDAVGRFCLRELKSYGVEHDHASLVAGDLRTSLAVVETRMENCQSVIYRNGAADLALSIEDIMSIDFQDYGALVITGTALATHPSRSATMLALERARAAGVLTIMDVDYRPYSWRSAEEAREVKLVAAKACDVIVGNDVEFGLMAGCEKDGLTLAHDFVAQGAALSIYKMGERGAVSISPEGAFRTGIYRTTAIKPTGAGDAFMGGLLSALSRGLDLRTAVLRGSAAAAITVSRVGCAPAFPTADELDAFVLTAPQPELH